MEEKAHIITERAFGSSSRKIQFIGLEQVPTNNNPTANTTNSTNSTSSATTNNISTYHVRSVDSLLNNNYQEKEEHGSTSSSTNNHNTMSIESLLSVEEDNYHNTNYLYPRQSQSASSHEISVSSLLTSDNTNNYKRKNIEPIASNSKKIKQKEKITTITCLHAAVAQKSYGSEKRFLCPPPIVRFTSPSDVTSEYGPEKIQLSMSIIHENGDKILEQHTTLDESRSGSFKYLHVTGTAKAKQFHLKVDVHSLDESIESPLCSFTSNPVSIISKPSKKTAKSRNVSTCIFANMPVSLFNRINSQTVRTKYMSSSDNMLCAKNTTWSPFDIIILNQPKPPLPHYTKYNPTKNRFSTTRLQLNYSPPPPQQQEKTPIHVTYGTEIMLRDVETGVTSPPLVIRKVDKNRIAPCAYGPVSQMQKIALQLASSLNSQPIYLSASGTDPGNSTWLDYSPSRLIQPENMSLELSYEEVEDYLCWTIVGIHEVQYELDESTLQPSLPPPSLYPHLTYIEYREESHTLHVIGQHLIQAAPVPRLLDLWLDTYGPLATKVSKPPQPQTPHETHWTVQLPSHLSGKELNLLLVRQDGLVFQTGKALVHESGRWMVK